MSIIRRILLAMTLAVTATLLVPAAPATAAGQEVTICFQVGDVGGRPIFDCHTVVIPTLGPNPPWPSGCLSCPSAIELWDKIDPKIRWEYQDLLGQGLALLGKSKNTADAYEAKKLRAVATDTFLAAARATNKHEVALKTVGWADLKNTKLIEDTQPELKNTGYYVAEGLALFQKALGDPDPEPNIAAGMSTFDKAYENLSGLYAG